MVKASTFGTWIITGSPFSPTAPHSLTVPTRYLDLAGDFSAGLFGHTALPPIRSAVLSVLDSVGLSLGTTTAPEQRYAALLCARFRLGRVRMANSGTEANLYALAAARHVTGKRKVVVFAGGYHGGVLTFPVDGGGGAPKPAGNTVDRDDFVVVERYNDGGEAEEVIERVAAEGDLAAVLVEAVQGAGGVIPGTEQFLRAVREAARQVGGSVYLGRGHDLAAGAARAGCGDGVGAGFGDAGEVSRGRVCIWRVRWKGGHHGCL